MEALKPLIMDSKLVRQIFSFIALACVIWTPLLIFYFNTKPAPLTPEQKLVLELKEKGLWNKLDLLIVGDSVIKQPEETTTEQSEGMTFIEQSGSMTFSLPSTEDTIHFVDYTHENTTSSYELAINSEGNVFEEPSYGSGTLKGETINWLYEDQGLYFEYKKEMLIKDHGISYVSSEDEFIPIDILHIDGEGYIFILDGVRMYNCHLWKEPRHLMYLSRGRSLHAWDNTHPSIEDFIKNY